MSWVVRGRAACFIELLRNGWLSRGHGSYGPTVFWDVGPVCCGAWWCMLRCVQSARRLCSRGLPMRDSQMLLKNGWRGLGPGCYRSGLCGRAVRGNTFRRHCVLNGGRLTLLHSFDNAGRAPAPAGSLVSRPSSTARRCSLHALRRRRLPPRNMNNYNVVCIGDRPEAVPYVVFPPERNLHLGIRVED